MSTLGEDYELVTDQSAIDPVAAHAYLTTSCWSRGIPLETVQRALAGSLCVAVRHAGAQRCTIKLSVAERLDLEIDDNGCGIQAAAAAGVGMLSMCERAAELGGACQVTSMPGAGTAIRVWLPLTR